MPYVPGGGPQATAGSPEVLDVYHSTNVFVNSVPVALWQPPQASAAVALPEINSVALSTEQLEAITLSAAAANSDAEKEVGLAGVGEVPHEGPLVQTSTSAEAAAGDVSTSTTSTFVVSTSTGELFVDLARTIDTCLAEAKQGAWKETGSNSRILACYSAVGVKQASDSVPWCAAFAGSSLKNAGAPALKTLSSLAYRGYGTPVPLQDKSKWRLNDVVVFSRSGGGHIGFFRGYNPSSGSVLIAGGNQSDNLTEVGFKSSGMPIVYVGRAWSVPVDYDKPVTYSGSGGSVKVV
jgi:uncharacterized protein (TIGR02594 family)